ncbi:MAG: hypothetical protein EPN91_12790 [Salinibacterium sp.]|nr:MAG: hypothetical protein EPN91_12790 [Salinibacterium sp.]
MAKETSSSERNLAMPAIGAVAHAARRLVHIFRQGITRSGSLASGSEREAVELASEIGAWASAVRTPKTASSAGEGLWAPLFCPRCKDRHVDEGLWARRPHHTHLCLACGFKWRVEPYTFGEAPPKPEPKPEPPPADSSHAPQAEVENS